MAGRIILVVGLVLALCVGATQAATARSGGLVMGTVLDVAVRAPTLEHARTLSGTALVVARYWDEVLSNWRADAELERLNRHAGRWLHISPHLEWALLQMRTLTESTEGAFQPCVGSALQKANGKATRPAVPSFGESLEIQSGAARVRPGCSVDSGGIGKGLAIDGIVDLLLQLGAEALFINFGGSSQTFVSTSGDEVVQVAVLHLDNSRPLGTISLRDASVSTSRTPADQGSGVILDPRSGTVVDQPRMATVCADTATKADAWSTALVVLGEAGLMAADRNGVRAILQEADRWVVTPSFLDARSAQPQGGFCHFQPFNLEGGLG